MLFQEAVAMKIGGVVDQKIDGCELVQSKVEQSPYVFSPTHVAGKCRCAHAEFGHCINSHRQ